ncbi:pathogenesis-related protein 5-like isoform X2 [Canna indica]|uniref:Pathogenesis-related protein 5-like isoform X2 n=1 Tax=Canna indica TaxID=4628 RepID=A0AAQ3KNT7_9LILI|nr:pathogenesis-related protein 5-like isoform X2 [Canna indica]
MDDHHIKLLLKILLVFLSGGRASEGARVFTIVNYCKTTIWPGITPGDSFDGGGFALKPGESAVFTAPVGWIGRIWGRTGCDFDSDGSGSCQTGACGSALKCGASGQTPATLAEFTLAPLDFYDVSLVDGFNLPVTLTPVNARGGNCSAAGCDGDLRENCPSDLAIKVDGETVACRSACDVFNTDEYCCRGAFGNPDTCRPTYYSEIFKQACPGAYSYAYDDPTSIFTCTDADYIVSFCSNFKSKKQKVQRVCTYHINKLVCSASPGRASSIWKWLVVLLLCFTSLWSSL